MPFKQKLGVVCSSLFCFFLALHFKTSGSESFRDRVDVTHIYHSIIDRSLYFGSSIALGMGSVIACLFDGEDWQLLSELCGSSAQIAWHQMVSAPSSWVRSSSGKFVPRSHRLWYENQWRLSQIPRTTQEQAVLLSFLEKRWLAKANGFYPMEVNVMAPCFGVDQQVSPVTKNSYARDPFTQVSQVYENCVNAWKKSLPHPTSYPLILTRPHNLSAYLPPSSQIIDLTDCFPSDAMDAQEWLQLWEKYQTSLRKLYCAPSGFVNFGGPQNGTDLEDREEAHIASIWATNDRSKMGHSDGRKNSQNLTVLSISRPICVQRVEQNGLGGIRLLPLAGEETERDYQSLLSWISVAGLTADIVELDRLSDDSPLYGNMHSPSDMSVDAFAEAVHAVRINPSIMVNGCFAILENLIDHMRRSAPLCQTCASIVQMSMVGILEALGQIQTASSIEKVYLHILPLLEIFSPFRFEDFSPIYARVLALPKSLEPLTDHGLFASGMTGLAGIFKATHKTLGRAPRVIYGMNTYFECIQMAKHISPTISEEEAASQDWETVDLLLVQFNPVLRRDNPKNYEYQIESIGENIRKSLYGARPNFVNFCGHQNGPSLNDRSSPILMQYGPPRDPPNLYHSEDHQNSQNLGGRRIPKNCQKRLTVAFDATIDFLDSSRMKDLIATFQNEIQEGILNIVCYRSGLKFDLFGMDNYSGAPFFTIHAKDPYWAPFDALLMDPALQTDSLSLQWFCLAFQSASRELDLYRRQIFQNTRALLHKIPKSLFNPDMRYRVVPVADSVDPSFIDIKVFGPLHKMRAAALVGGCLYLRSMQEGFPIFYRRSFGFSHPNFGILFAEDCSTIRLTLGLDPAQIDVYARCLEEINRLNRFL